MDADIAQMILKEIAGLRQQLAHVLESLPRLAPQGQLHTYDEVATLLRVSVQQVARYVTRRQLKCVDLGHRAKRFRQADVDRFIARRAGDRIPEWL